MLNENYLENISIAPRKFSKIEKTLINFDFLPNKILEKALEFLNEFQIKFNYPKRIPKLLIYSSIYKSFNFYNQTIDHVFLHKLLFPNDKKVKSFLNKVFNKFLNDLQINHHDIVPFYIDNYMSNLTINKMNIDHMNRETILEDVYELLNDFLESKDEKIQLFLKETSTKHVVLSIITHYMIENEMYSCRILEESFYMCNPAIQKYLNLYESLVRENKSNS